MGGAESGIARIEEVRRLVCDEPVPAIIARTYGNLSSVLEGAGRSAEAVRITREGQTLIGTQVTGTTRSWLLLNEGESLIAMGRYGEAAVPLAESIRLVEGAYPRAGVELQLGFLALGVGDVEAAAGHHASAAEGLRRDTQPQHHIPLRMLALRLAVAQGRPQDARRELLAAIEAGFPPGTTRFAWPLLAIGAAVDPEAVRDAARELSRPTPLAQAYELLVRAELAPAPGDPELWGAAEAAFVKEERPVELAEIRCRWAEALLAAGPESREEAGRLLGLAHAAAKEAGAVPLAEQVAALAQRARLRSAAPTGAVESLGLTARERDVLRLVAEGRTNRQIAEQLFISPKTASVHVSNILAKLTVSTRTEAAALAHRLHLFPPAQ